MPETERLENGVSRLKIPNREIWDIYNEKIRGWFHESVRSYTDRMTKLCEAVKQGNAAEVQSAFNASMQECISIRDTYVRKELKENFYHGMLLGILQCEDNWVVKSNQESGTGYGDILLTSPKDWIGCVIEMKYAQNGAFENPVRRLYSRSRRMIIRICRETYISEKRLTKYFLFTNKCSACYHGYMITCRKGMLVK